jgi:hypothetical protein
LEEESFVELCCLFIEGIFLFTIEINHISLSNQEAEEKKNQGAKGGSINIQGMN